MSERLISIGGIKVTREMAAEIERLTPPDTFHSETIRAALEYGIPKLARKRAKKGKKS